MEQTGIFGTDHPNSDIPCRMFHSKLMLGEQVTEQGSSMVVFRYPEHPRISDRIPDSPEQ